MRVYLGGVTLVRGGLFRARDGSVRAWDLAQGSQPSQTRWIQQAII